MKHTPTQQEMDNFRANIASRKEIPDDSIAEILHRTNTFTPLLKAAKDVYMKANWGPDVEELGKAIEMAEGK